MPDVQAFRFEDDGETPNNPRLPLVVYRAAVNLAGALIQRRRSNRPSPSMAGATAGATASIPSCTSTPPRTRCWASRGAAATVEFGGAKGRC